MAPLKSCFSIRFHDPYHRLTVLQTPDAEESADGTQPTSAERLTFTTGERERLRGRCVFFVRLQPKAVDLKSFDTDVISGELTGNPLDSFQLLLKDIYSPLLHAQENWGRGTKEEYPPLCSR